VSTAEPRLRDFVLYFLKLGALGFGGPIALVGYMQRDLVEQRGWLTKDDYAQGLALAQLAPGPLAAQVSIYIGWVRGGALGAGLVGLAFVLPSFLMVIALAWLYLHFGGVPGMQAAFYGVGSAVIALIARGAWKLVKSTVAKDKLAWAIFAVNAVVTAWTESELVSVIVGSGLVMLAVRAWPRKLPVVAPLLVPPLLVPPWFVTGLHGPADEGTLWRIATFFTEAGAFVFGSGLAIVPFLRGGVVEQFSWLNDQQFLDAVAVAMITPGPVVITVAFIGYLAAGPLGAALAAVCTFVPCYVFTVLPAPYFRKYAENKQVKAFVTGVTAAATGAIAGAAFVLGRRALIDIPTVLICLTTLLVLARFKIQEPLVILAAGALGIALSAL
jgi:chromate transporter